MATRSGPSAISGANDAAAITPHITTAIEPTAAVTASGAGTAVVRFRYATTDVTVQLNAGEIYPYQIIACRAVGTTATGIIALYN